MTLEEYCKQEGDTKVRVREVDGVKYILVAWRHDLFKHINGYVGVPKGSKHYGYHEGYDWNGFADRNGWLNVYGGCTYAGSMKAFDLFDEGYHFIGFDTGHYDDLQPRKYSNHLDKFVFQDIEIEDANIGKEDGYKDMKFVWSKIENILEQVTSKEEENV